MKKKSIATMLLAFCFLAVPLTVSADSQNYTPPPQKGTIYVIVRFTKGFGVVPLNTKASVRWGNWNKSGSFHPGGGRLPKDGFVIRLRHTKNDSVPLTVETEGRIERIFQGDPPSEWSNGNYHTANW